MDPDKNPLADAIMALAASIQSLAVIEARKHEARMAYFVRQRREREAWDTRPRGKPGRPRKVAE